jgi:twinkle protein
VENNRSLLHGIKGVVIDPWNEIDHAYSGLTEAQYLSKSLSKIRQFARRNGVHIWVVAHPRNLQKDDHGGYRPPTMYEISGGAHWRNKADCGICIHREDYTRDETSVYVQKVRFREVGQPGEAVLNFCRDTGTYSDGGYNDE